jgi:hypothetical protein
VLVAWQIQLRFIVQEAIALGSFAKRLAAVSDMTIAQDVVVVMWWS